MYTISERGVRQMRMPRYELSEQESKTYDWLVKETKQITPTWAYVIAQIVVGLFLLGYMIAWYWVSPTMTLPKSLLVGGQFLGLLGASTLAMEAFSLRPSTIALISMTKRRGNPALFAMLMNSRLRTRISISFIAVGFFAQGIGTLAVAT